METRIQLRWIGLNSLDSTVSMSLPYWIHDNVPPYRMSLSERLGMEDSPGESIKQHSFGSREMNYVVKKAPKFERLRQQQKEHQEERRKIRRSTNKLKGKFRVKEPL